MTCECPAAYKCRECFEQVCAPHDIGQPDCSHAGDLCGECRLACSLCAQDYADTAAGERVDVWGDE